MHAPSSTHSLVTRCSNCGNRLAVLVSLGESWDQAQAMQRWLNSKQLQLWDEVLTSWAVKRCWDRLESLDLKAFAQHLHSICTAFAQHLHSICTAFAEHLHSICTAFAQHLHSICTAFAQHLHSTAERQLILPAWLQKHLFWVRRSLSIALILCFISTGHSGRVFILNPHQRVSWHSMA